MAAHARHGIEDGSPPLDLGAFERVRVVARPALREVVERTAVKSAASACAAFKEDIGEGLRKPLGKIVKSQNIAVTEFALPVGGQIFCKVFRHFSVLIPFYIGDIVFPQDLAHRLEDIVDDLLPREVEDELSAPAAGFNARLCDRPVGMRAEKVAVLAHHLGLKPKAEFQPPLLAAVDDRTKPAFELVFVDRPIAETGGVAVALAEPAVVENEGIDPEFCRFVDDGKQLFVVKVEVGRLPIVDDDGTARIHIFGIDDGGTEEIVVRARHPAQSLSGIAQRRLRRFQRLARAEFPAEKLIADTALHAGDAVVRQFRGQSKTAAVKERKPVAFAPLLACVLFDKRKEGIHMMRGISARRAQPQDALRKRRDDGRAFPPPCARQAQSGEDPSRIRKFRAEGERLFDLHGLASHVSHGEAANKDVGRIGNRIFQIDLRVGKVIFQGDNERFIRLPCTGHSLERKRALFDLMGKIAEPAHPRSVRTLDHDRRLPKISAREAAAFGGHHIRLHIIVRIVRMRGIGFAVRFYKERRVR